MKGDTSFKVVQEGTSFIVEKDGKRFEVGPFKSPEIAEDYFTKQEIELPLRLVLMLNQHTLLTQWIEERQIGKTEETYRDWVEPQLHLIAKQKKQPKVEDMTEKRLYLLVGGALSNIKLVGPFTDAEEVTCYQTEYGLITAKVITLKKPEEHASELVDKRVARLWQQAVVDGETQLGLVEWKEENARHLSKVDGSWKNP